mgnify:FL=1
MKKGDIYLIDLASSFGHEQCGFRPAILMSQTVAGMIIVVPLTTNLEALRFPYTLSILENSTNNLSQNSIALVFQLKSIDKKRVNKKIGRLGNQDMTKLEKTLKDLLDFRK